jgi:penicillin-binding protein 1A
MAPTETTRPGGRRPPRANAPRASTTRKGRAPKPRRGARIALVALKLGLAAAVLAALGAVGTIWYFSRDLPEVATLRDYRPPQTTRVVDRRGALLGEVFVERRTVIPMDRIPRVMVLSVLAAEDADFYEHEGLDYQGILRAVLRDVLTRRAAQGASTITQQVVKLLLLSPERTVKRKIRELVLARRLEQELTKDEILWLYLNHINFGQGHYGVEEAARFYFGKHAMELTLAEASLLAGVPQSPARLDPRRHPEAARARQLYVLRQLEAKRGEYWPDLSVEAIGAAREQAIELASVDRDGSAAPEVMRIARDVLREQVGEEAYRRGGYTVHTTIDVELEREAREALKRGLLAVDARHGYRGPLSPPRRRRPLPPVATLRSGRTYLAEVTGVDSRAGRLLLSIGGHPGYLRFADITRENPDALPIDRFAVEGARVHVSIDAVGEGDEPSRARLELGPEGAVVVIDAQSRDVLALVGAFDAAPGFDRATQALRQPGSTFKPLVFAQGIRARAITPATTILDAPAVYDQWKPQNYETWRFEGAVRARTALARSINLVAVRVIEQVGPESVVDLARSLGITSPLEPSLSLALGASEVRPIELVNAYATFAAGGRFEPARIVSRIEGPGGEPIALPAPEAPRDVLTPAEAYVVTDLLRSVVTEGTASKAQALGRPLAGKTGTSNEARDAWFVGYSPRVVAGVWVGFDDRRPLGRRESGGHTALPIWIDVMRRAERGRPPVDFPRPSGVVTARIDPSNGLLAYDGMEAPLEEVFLDGTAPVETSRPPDVADSQTFLMEQFGLPPEPETSPEASPSAP